MTPTRHTRFFATIALAAALAGAAGAAGAVTLVGSSTSGGTTVTDYSALDLASFDLDLRSTASAVLNFRLDASDGAMPLQLSAMLRNFTGEGLGGYRFDSSRGSFTLLGSVTRQFGGGSSSASTGASATMSFDSLEFLDVEVGDALGSTVGAVNWRIGGLQAGDVFSLTVTAVPEPGSYALLLAGLVAVGAVARRRAKTTSAAR